MKNITQKIVSLFTVAFTVTFNVVATTLLSFNDAGAQTPSFTTSAVGPYTIATRLPFPGSPSGFDRLGNGTGGGTLFWSFEDLCSTPGSGGLCTTPEVGVTAIPFGVNYKQKATAVWTIYSNNGFSINFNLVQGWQIDIWSNQAALINNPWNGDINTQVWPQPHYGSLTNIVGGSSGGNPNYLIGFDITDVVLPVSSQSYYLGVRPLYDTSVHGFALGGVAESSSDTVTGYYVFDFGNGNTGHGPTTGLQPSTQNATPAYKMEGVYCPPGGAPC